MTDQSTAVQAKAFVQIIPYGNCSDLMENRTSYPQALYHNNNLILFIILTTEYEMAKYYYEFLSAPLLDKGYINSCSRQIYLISFPIKKVLESQAGCSLFISHSMSLVFAAPAAVPRGCAKRVSHRDFWPAR